jgi:hypothetical protein
LPAAPAFPNAAKIALIHLDEPFDGHGVLQLLGDELPKPMKEIGGCLAVDADLEPTAAFPHSLILDPLRIWDSRKNFLPYQSRCLPRGTPEMNLLGLRHDSTISSTNKGDSGLSDL